MSRLVVDRLQGNAATGNKITIPAGHSLVGQNLVLQTVQTVYTTQVAQTGSTTYSDLFSVTITPKGNNSKFLVDTVLTFSDNGRGYTTNNQEARFRIWNSYTQSGVSPGANPSGSGYTDQHSFWGWDAELGYTLSDEANAYLIKQVRHMGESIGSVAGTPITFTVQWRSTSANTNFLNRVYQAATSGHGVSAIRVTEIGQ